MRFTTAGTSTNKVGVQIYDDEVYLPGGLGWRFTGLYQNGVSIGTLLWNDSVISYNGKQVLELSLLQGYTLALRLRSSALPNGDYEIGVRYTDSQSVTHNCTIPIVVDV